MRFSRPSICRLQRHHGRHAVARECLLRILSRYAWSGDRIRMRMCLRSTIYMYRPIHRIEKWNGSAWRSSATAQQIRTSCRWTFPWGRTTSWGRETAFRSTYGVACRSGCSAPWTARVAWFCPRWARFWLRDARSEMCSKKSRACYARNFAMFPRMRTVRVYVVGDVAEPGAYDVSSLSTPLNALFAAGGVKPQGSLRRIQHYRGKQLVEEVDAYDLLLHGIRSDLKRLENGDSLLVPPLGPVVTVDGMVRRAAWYELRDEKDLEDALDLAGGTFPAP